MCYTTPIRRKFCPFAGRTGRGSLSYYQRIIGPVAGQEAILIEPRKIHQSGAKREPQPSVGRQVNVNNSRRDPAPSGKPPKEPKEKSRHPLLRFLGRTLAMLICLGIMAGSLLMVGMVYYAV